MSGGVFWNQAQKNFTHLYTEYPWLSVTLSLCDSVTLWLCHSEATIIIAVTPSRWTLHKGWSNSGSSHMSEPAHELHSRAAPSVGGNTTTHLVQPQGEIPEEGKNTRCPQGSISLLVISIMLIQTSINVQTLVIDLIFIYYHTTQSWSFLWMHSNI